MKKIKIVVAVGIILVICAITAVILTGKKGIEINKKFHAIIWATGDDSEEHSVVTVEINMRYRNKKYSGDIRVYARESNDVLYEYNNVTVLADSYGDMKMIEHSKGSNTASFIMFNKNFSKIAIFPTVEVTENESDNGSYTTWDTENTTVITAPADTLEEAIKVMDSYFPKTRPSWGDGVLKYDLITPDDIIVK